MDENVILRNCSYGARPCFNWVKLCDYALGVRAIIVVLRPRGFVYVKLLGVSIAVSITVAALCPLFAVK